MDENIKPDVTEKKKAEPLPVDAEERWEWDADLGPPPPPLRRTRIMVRFHRREAQPLPYPDPEIDMSDKNALEQAEKAKTIRPSLVAEEDVEKDDVNIVRPTPRRSGTILVHLKYGGRRKPIPVDFPDGEDKPDQAAD
jgi:hypothetical protein